MTRRKGTEPLFSAFAEMPDVCGDRCTARRLWLCAGCVAWAGLGLWGGQLSHRESGKTLGAEEEEAEAGLASPPGPNRLPPSKSQLAGHLPEGPCPRRHQFSSLSVPVPRLPQHSCPQIAWLTVHLLRPVTAWTAPTVFTADPCPSLPALCLVHSGEVHISGLFFKSITAILTMWPLANTVFSTSWVSTQNLTPTAEASDRMDHLRPEQQVSALGGNCKAIMPISSRPLFKHCCHVDVQPLPELRPGQGTHCLPQPPLSISGTTWDVKKYRH